MANSNYNYYHPDIHDIFLGYEAESFNNGKWEEIRYSTKDFEDLPYDIDGKWIRTLYLTQDQVIKEGWQKSGDILLTNEKSEHVFRRETINDGQNFHGFVLKLLSDNYVAIYEYDADKEMGGDYITRYKGLCKSVNEFRQICRLLKIKE